jgi:hypothetical protein
MFLFLLHINLSSGVAAPSDFRLSATAPEFLACNDRAEGINFIGYSFGSTCLDLSQFSVISPD